MPSYHHFINTFINVETTHLKIPMNNMDLESRALSVCFCLFVCFSGTVLNLLSQHDLLCCIYLSRMPSCQNYHLDIHLTQITKFMRPSWGPSGSCRPQVGPMLAPWTLLSGKICPLSAFPKRLTRRTNRLAATVCPDISIFFSKRLTGIYDANLFINILSLRLQR